MDEAPKPLIGSLCVDGGCVWYVGGFKGAGKAGGADGTSGALGLG